MRKAKAWLWASFRVPLKGAVRVPLRVPILIGCKLNFSTFGGSCKVVDSESFNFYFLGFWAREYEGSIGLRVWALGLSGLRVWALGLSGLRVWALGLSGLRVWVLGLSGFRIWGCEVLDGFARVLPRTLVQTCVRQIRIVHGPNR